MAELASYASETYSPIKPADRGASVNQSASLVVDELAGINVTTQNLVQSRKEAQQLRRAHVLNRALPLQWVEQNLHHRIASDGFYTDFLMYIPFLILFLIFFFNGRDIETNHMAAAGNKKLYMELQFPNVAESVAMLNAQGDTDSPTLPKDRSFEDIESAEHFHSWFSSVLVPGTWDCAQPGYSRSTLVKRGQMQYIGAMKIRVLVAKNDSCEVNTNYDGGGPLVFGNETTDTVTGESPQPFTADPSTVLPRYCYKNFDSDQMLIRNRCERANPALPEEQLWRFYHSNQDGDGLHTTGQMTIYPSGGYVATVPFNATCDQVQGLLDVFKSDSECNIFNDLETRFVMLEWFQYAANTDTFMMNKYFFEVVAGGYWITNSQVRMFPVWTEKRLGMSIFDIFFFVFVLYFVYRLFYDWVAFYRLHKKVLAFVFDLWNLMEVINITTLVTVCVLRWTWWTRCRNSNVSFPFDNEYPKDLDSLVLIFSAQIYANSVNVVITILKILKYFQLNNRLNILTRTLAVAQQGIIGVLALFLFIVTGYAVCGVQLYGAHMYDFKNVNTAFSSLSFMLLGQFDYAAMRALQPDLTGLFFFTFVILCNFLLLNFIIAILSDGFADVSKDTALEPLDESILNQIYVISYYLSFRNMKKIIELRKKGKSRVSLLRDVHKYIGEHIDLIAKHSPSMLDNDIPMHRTDLKHWLPEQLYADLGEPYIDLLWEDMVRDYLVAAEAESYQLHKDIEVAVTKGVAMVVKKDLTIEPLVTLAESMARIDRLVDVVTSLDPAGRPRRSESSGGFRHEDSAHKKRMSIFGIRRR
jgi:hypothetical protein